MVIGPYLAELRRRSNLSLRQLGALATVSWSTVHRTEHGKRDYTLSQLEGVAGAYGVSVQDLLGWATVEAKYPPKVCACKQKEVS